MQRLAALPAALVCLASCACAAAPNSPAPVPPKAEQRPHLVRSPHGDRQDEFYWLRDDTRKNPEMLAYLATENTYREAMLAHTQPAQHALDAEMVARIKQDDASVPAHKRGYWYYSRFDTGKEYPVHARKRGTLEAPEEVMLDGNALAAGHSFFAVGRTTVTMDNKILA